MSDRAKRIGNEAAKFTAVNVVATVVALLIFNSLVHGVKGWYDGPLHAHPLTTYLIANTVGMFVSYYGSRKFAFKHRKAVGPGGGFVGYVAVNYSSFVIPIGCLWLSRNAFGWDTALADNVAGNVVGAVLGNVFRFWAFRRFVFRRNTRVWQGQRELGRDPVGAGIIGRVGSSVAPELGPLEPELGEHQAQQGHADAYDVVGIAGDAGDEGAAETVEGEAAGDVEGLPGRHVGRDLGVTDRGEPDLRRG